MQQPYRRSGSLTTQRLWKQYSMDPSQWSDKRKSKSNRSSSDVKHQMTRESMWIDACYNPDWIKCTFEKAEATIKGYVQIPRLVEFRLGSELNVSEAQRVRGNSGWEILSLEEALTSLERIPHPPSVQDLTCILLQCRAEKNIAYAKRLHNYMCKNGLETHRSLGNYLIPLLVDVGSMCDAQQVFDTLVKRNEYSWTSLITGYIQCGESQRALNLYQKMQKDCVQPSKYTFVALLQACARLKDARRGQLIHAEIAQKGLESDIFIGSTLVDMYAKCGLPAKAQESFDKLPVRNEVSWNALMAGYAKHGLGEEALNCFEQMQLAGVSPNAITFACSLNACGSLGALGKGQKIHAEIARRGLERDLFVGSSLVSMYAKCGSLARAQEVFNKLPVQNVVSWTALITGYAKQGRGEEALNCFEQMQLEGYSPNAPTFVCSLIACGSIGDICKGREIHADIAKTGLLEGDPLVGNALVDMYAKCGLLAKAHDALNRLSVRNEVSWNALITGYANHGLGEEALNCFEQMQLEGVCPDAYTFVCSLKACGSIGAIGKGQEIHAQISRNGLLDGDPFIGNTLVHMYAKCGMLAKAREVFDKLPSWNVVSWTALLSGYAEHGHATEALQCFEQMQLEGFRPDALTFVCSLKACSSLVARDKGQDIHFDISRMGLEEDIFVGSTLVDMYAKCGLLAKAQEVFDKLPVRNVVSWTALITGYAHLGESENVFHMFERMGREGISPDRVTFLSVLTVCSHAGLVDRGQKYFDTMTKDYGITPTIEHHTCMVNLLGRAGQLDKVISMMKHFPSYPYLDVWHTVLAACRKWGDVELGRHTFEQAVQCDENDAAVYVLMSNIYADARMQEDKIEGGANEIERTTRGGASAELLH